MKLTLGPSRIYRYGLGCAPFGAVEFCIPNVGHRLDRDTAHAVHLRWRVAKAVRIALSQSFKLTLVGSAPASDDRGQDDIQIGNLVWDRPRYA